MKESIFIKNVFNKCKVTSIVLALPIFMFLIFAPVEIFYSSFADFDFELKDFIWLFSGIAVLLWFLVTIIISLLPQKINAFINGIVFVFSISFYVQGMFLNKQLIDIGIGHMDWNSMKSYTIINAIEWLVMIAVLAVVLFLFKKYREKLETYLSLFLIIIQAVALVSLIITLSSDAYKTSHYKLDPSKEFEFAKDENVIVLLLDMTAERFFQEASNEYPELLDGLEDFTYYTNYEPCYMTTCPAVTYMWTNNTPDCTTWRTAWLAKAWESERTTDFFNRIHDKGYECRFYTNHQEVLFGDVENLLGRVDNVVRMDGKVNVKLMLPMLEKFAIYRYVPYVLKPRFEVNLEHFRGVVTYEEQFDHNEAMIDYYEHIQAKPITVNNDLSKLVYYHHFDGIHGPWTIDENGNRHPEGETDIAYRKNVIRGDMIAVRYFLNQLKDAGIYDNSTIIISADHGDFIDRTDLQCIFFIKRSGETHDTLQYNKAPISVDDFHSSVLSFIGDDNYSDFGKTYFEWNEGDSRDRYSMIRDLGGLDGFYGYEYNGDGDALLETIEDGIDREIPNVGGWCQ